MVNQVCLSGLIVRIEDNNVYYEIETDDGVIEMTFLADDNLAEKIQENIESFPMVATVIGKLTVVDDMLCVSPDVCKVSFLETKPDVLS